jgi:chondroitin-sulfate-ABC endolyase/exolyase
MKKLVLFLFSIIVSSISLKAQIYSFEDGLVPTNWSTTLGTLQSSTIKYKLGTKSLCWTWNAGSKVTVSTPAGLSTASTNSSGGIYFWIYNTTPSTSTLIFSFLNSSNQVKCHLDFNLNFKGWRCITTAFVADLKHDKSALTHMTVQAPTTGIGTIYFDDIEFITSVMWDRMSDAQYSLGTSNSLTLVDYWAVRKNGNFGVVPTATTTQIAAADTIIKRLDNWYVSTNKYPLASESISRKSGLNGQINYALTHNTGDLNLSVGTDGTVTGVGLYPDYADENIDGITIRKFSNVETGSMLPLAFDYRLNKTALSKTRWLNQIDWFFDQGWADGSALGTLRFEKLRSAGYFHSLFMMRNELGVTRLDRELNNLNWAGLWGNANMPFLVPGENADQIRSMCIAKLDYALLQPDANKRVAALTAVKGYFDNAFSIAPGFAETFKPDFSGYHHLGIYLSAYYPEALYSACWVYYLLHDTPYALSDSVYSILKNCLLNFRIIASEYDVPVSCSGRFPTGTTRLDDILPAFAYLALSKSTPDNELMAAFSRLWKPTVSPLKDFISRSATDICYQSSLGEIELCLQAASLKVTAENAPKTTLYLPYSGLMINRSTNHHISLKGFSKYIWDFEGDATNNPYGKYLSYGQLEYTDLITGRSNNNYDNINWDWNRIPGTTTKYLPLSKLTYTAFNLYRNFSNDPFLGGVSLNDSTSLFSMKLHDNAFDQSLYANKSVFNFGNVLVCVGSNINCNDNAVRTETTLFQQVVNAGEFIKVNGNNVTTNQSNLTQPIIQDNIGNRFIVRTGTVDVSNANGIYNAVINHGYAPTNQTYTYYMLLQSNSIQEAKYSNSATCPVSILRQDNMAHIVRKTDENVWGYAIFNSTLQMNDSWIKQVNTPSLIMFKVFDSSTFQLSVSDPDMHRASGTDTDALTDAIVNTATSSFNYEIILNGLFKLDSTNTAVTATISGNTTKLALTAIDGKSYSIGLKSVSTGVDSLDSNKSLQMSGSGTINNYIITSKDNKNVNITVNSLDGKIAKSLHDVSTPYSLDINGFKNGIFIVSINNSSDVLNQKILVK